MVTQTLTGDELTFFTWRLIFATSTSKSKLTVPFGVFVNSKLCENIGDKLPNKITKNKQKKDL
jgi:hypothetical protein